jgi:hypothetical protein
MKRNIGLSRNCKKVYTHLYMSKNIGSVDNIKK